MKAHLALSNGAVARQFQSSGSRPDLLALAARAVARATARIGAVVAKLKRAVLDQPSYEQAYLAQAQSHEDFARRLRQFT